jgi:AcrR family transcriptional regulator
MSAVSVVSLTTQILAPRGAPDGDRSDGGEYTVYSESVVVTKRAHGLLPEQIVEAAHRLISEHGLEWFSMRKLAAALDVNPMTVYLRFENKHELLDAVARHGLRHVRLPDLPDAPWDERALSLCEALRDHLLADRNLLGLYASSGRLSSAVAQSVDQGLGLMEEIGYEGADAVLAFRSVFWHTVGFALVDLNIDRFPADRPGGLEDTVGEIDESSHPIFHRHLPSFTAVDGDALFTHATRLLVAGLLGDAPQSMETP